MHKKLFSLILITTVFLTACSSQSTEVVELNGEVATNIEVSLNKEVEELEQVQDLEPREKTMFLDEYLQSDWINELPNEKWDEMAKLSDEQAIDIESKRCESIEDEDKRRACLLYLVAQNRESEGLGEEIKTLNLTEISGATTVAIYNNDIRVCRHVENAEERQLCYEYAYQIMVDECHTFEGKEYRNCVRDLSDKLPSFHEQRLFCGHIDDEEMRKECQGVAEVDVCDEIEDKDMREKCRLNIARTNGDIKTCENIEDPEYKEACIAIIGVTNDDESYCDMIEDEYIRGQCRAKLAMQKNDKSICNAIQDEDSKDICYGYFLVKTDVDQTMCNDINELFLKEMCEMVLAVQNADMNKCMDQKIVSLENRAICLAGIGVKHGNADICDKIDVNYGEFEEDRIMQEKIRDLCYAGAAQKIKDPSLCEKIQDEKFQDECNENVSTEEKQAEQTKSMTCAEVPPAICPMDNSANNGATIHLSDNGRDIQCTYYKSREDGYPLYNEVYKLGTKRDGTYKEYTKSGAIKKYNEYKDGRNDGFSMDCDGSALTRCYYYVPGSANIDCMP